MSALNYTYVSFEMASSNELCLQWNDFQENLRSSFKLLRQDTDFVDVTLVCEDGQKAEAHMVILASSSPILMDILRKSMQLKTLIYMRGTKWKDLVAVLDFIYIGEAKVEEENLESFFALAKDLQLKGLQRKPERETKDSDQVRTLSKYGSDIKMTNTAKSAKKMPEENPVTMTSTFRDMEDKIRSTEDKNQGRMSSNFRDVEEEIRSMVGISKNPPPGKTQGRARVCKVCGISFHILSYFNLSYHIISYHSYLCKVCGMESYMQSIIEHIKAKHHIDGLSLPCKHCGKTFSSRNELLQHTSHCSSTKKTHKS